MTIYHSPSKDTIVFHFNKKHLEDPSVPMWTIKVRGQTFYVSHLHSNVGFDTKETPDNPHTKGSLKFKGFLTISKADSIIIATIQNTSETYANAEDV